MFKLIKSRWKKIADDLKGTPLYWQRTTSSILFKKEFSRAIKKYVKGDVLDVGAGAMNYRSMIQSTGANYKSLDFGGTESKYDKNSKLDFVGDIQNLSFNDETYDTIFCSQVLEHIPEPQKALYEISRVLKKDGQALISVPHLAYLHNEPNDFYRYTKHGLSFMMEKANLNIIEIKSLGGFFSFIGYLSSTFWLSIFYKIPIIWQIVFYINLVVSYILIFLDKILMTHKILPLNYLVVVKKEQ